MTARRPSPLWRDYGSTSRLAIPHGPTMRVYHYAVDLTWRWYLDGANLSPKNDPTCSSMDAAKLAAEDAARALLLAGLATLGAGMPEGFAIEWDNPDKWAHAFLITDDEFGKPRRIHLGDSAEVTAVALGMLAAVRK